MEKKEYEYLQEIDISELVPVGVKGGKWVNEFRKWEETDNKALKITLPSQKEKIAAAAAIREWKRRNKKDYTIFYGKTGYVVYIVRS